MPRRLALSASTLALALVLVGCGSDDASSDGDGDATTTSEAAEAEATTEPSDDEDDATTAPDETTTPEGDTTTSEPDDDAPATTPGGAAPSADYCAAYAAFDESADDLPDETVEDIVSGGEILLEGIEDVASKAPDELREDLALLVDAVQLLVDEASEATTVEEARQAGSSVFGDEEFTAAAERVDTYYDESCPQADDEQAGG